MSTLHTQCPHCQTIYGIDLTALCESRGQVRCGCCGSVFLALERLAGQRPARGAIAATLFSDRPPTLVPDDADDGPEEDLFTAADGPIDFSSALTAPEPAAADKPRPLYDPDERWTPRGSQRSRWPWIIASLVLALALAAQFLWWEREQLLDDPRARPIIDRVCATLGCDLPMRRDLDRIKLVNRDIRPHPSVEEALIVNATLHNEAEFAQPYPAVEIRLSDLEGRPVAGRRFEPAEYLEAERDVDRGMAPGTMLPLVFEIVDPGDDAVAFEFVFR